MFDWYLLWLGIGFGVLGMIALHAVVYGLARAASLAYFRTKKEFLRTLMQQADIKEE